MPEKFITQSAPSMSAFELLLQEVHEWLHAVDEAGGDPPEHVAELDRVAVVHNLALLGMFADGMPFGAVILATYPTARQEVLERLAANPITQQGVREHLLRLCARRDGLHKRTAMLYAFLAAIYFSETGLELIRNEMLRLQHAPTNTCTVAFMQWFSDDFVPLMKSAVEKTREGVRCTARPDAFTEDEYAFLTDTGFFVRPDEFPDQTIKQHEGRTRKVLLVRRGIFEILHTTASAVATYLHRIPLFIEHTQYTVDYWQHCLQWAQTRAAEAEKRAGALQQDQRTETSALANGIERWHALMDRHRATNGGAPPPRIRLEDICTYQHLCGSWRCSAPARIPALTPAPYAAAAPAAPSTHVVTLSEADADLMVAESALLARDAVRSGVRSTAPDSLVHFMEAVLAGTQEPAVVPSLLGPNIARHGYTDSGEAIR